MYYNHNLRTNIQEWKNRLARANGFDQFGPQLSFFIKRIEKESVLHSIIQEATLLFPYDNEKIEGVLHDMDSLKNPEFESEAHQASFSYNLIKYIFSNFGNTRVLSMDFIPHSGTSERQSYFIEQYVSPITNFLHDQLDKSNSTIYLLEKYKRRTEWFKKDILFRNYQEANKNYEQILEDNLRLFLFDQGIDYPFSTPNSTSGRADIVGAIDTEDPIIIEIKIFDSSKGYGKKRIVGGFTQTVKYTNDYNKDFGYLVIFNLDEVEINFNFKETDNLFPPRLSHGNKNYFFIVVNLKPQESASKQGKTKTIEITESDLLQ